jgi:HEAT repeat protein
LVKKAVVSLGQIGEPAGIPALEHALVIEKKGVSFMPEATYSLFQLGPAAVDPVLKLLTDQDAAYLAWAKEHSRAPAGTYGKAAIVLGDLGDKRAVPALLAKLKYVDGDRDPETARILTRRVREFAADALGRLRVAEAAKPVLELVKTQDPQDEESVTFAANAEVWIGDRAVAAELVKRASQPGTFASRLLCAQAASLFGDPSLASALKAAGGATDKKTPAGECAAELAALNGVELEEKAACERLGEERAKAFAGLLAPLDAAQACGAKSDCWTGKLADAAPLVRARAAYELGRAGATAAVPALTKAAADTDLQARIAAIRALDWLSALPAAQPQLKASAAQLGAQLQAEQGSTRLYRVNEELRRLQARLARF